MQQAEDPNVYILRLMQMLNPQLSDHVGCCKNSTTPSSPPAKLQPKLAPKLSPREKQNARPIPLPKPILAIAEPEMVSAAVYESDLKSASTLESKSMVEPSSPTATEKPITQFKPPSKLSPQTKPPTIMAKPDPKPKSEKKPVLKSVTAPISTSESVLKAKSIPKSKSTTEPTSESKRKTDSKLASEHTDDPKPGIDTKPLTKSMPIPKVVAKPMPLAKQIPASVPGRFGEMECQSVPFTEPPQKQVSSHKVESQPRSEQVPQREPEPEFKVQKPTITSVELIKSVSKPFTKPTPLLTPVPMLEPLPKLEEEPGELAKPEAKSEKGIKSIPKPISLHIIKPTMKPNSMEPDFKLTVEPVQLSKSPEKVNLVSEASAVPKLVSTLISQNKSEVQLVRKPKPLEKLVITTPESKPLPLKELANSDMNTESPQSTKLSPTPKNDKKRSPLIRQYLLQMAYDINPEMGTCLEECVSKNNPFK